MHKIFLFFMGVAFVSLARIAPADEVPDVVRLKYNHPGLVVDLGVGLWAWPLPVDYDADGDLDLVVSCPDVPYGGTYFFENPGGDTDARLPVFKPAVRLGPALRNVTLSWTDGRPRILSPAHEHTGFFTGDLARRLRLYDREELLPSGGRIRANQWSLVDYDGDGALDLVAGHGAWSDYGWDNAFDASGQWTRGPLHGYVYLIRNRGSTDEPEYEEPRPVTAGGKPVDVFGMPSPSFADFDGDGDLDLVCGEFLDGFTYFHNTGTRTAPEYASGRRLLSTRGQPLEMHLCMIVVTAVDWDRDGDVDLVVGQEDGRVALVEHTGEIRDGMPRFAAPRFFQQEADDVKFGALVTPVGFDWDGDGDDDLVCGNTAGEIGWIENLDGGNPPKWSAPQLMEAAGRPIRIMAGPNGSIQGPAEAKWGYTAIAVADWNHDGLPDIVANSIWGRVEWFRNTGTRRAPRLAAAEPVRVAWPGKPPKPAWNWWDPNPEELATQWRTTPCAVDWNGDQLVDLVMLDHEGYLALFPRERHGDALRLGPGRRIFRGGSYDSIHKPAAGDGLLQLNHRTAGASGRRKLCIVDWDRDGLLDLLVNSQNVHFLRQVPSGGAEPRVRFEDRGPLVSRRLAGHTTSPTTVDWNRDGVRELVIGAEDGYLYVVE